MNRRHNLRAAGPLRRAGIHLPLILILLFAFGSLQSQSLQKIEYFYDTDPGIGQGSIVNVPPGTSPDSLTLQADISSLSEGMHTLFIRVLDDSNRWSMTHRHPFFKVGAPGGLSQLDRIVYSFNAGGSAGSGTPVLLTGGQPPDSAGFALALTSLSTGMNTLFLRVADSDGKWSQTLFRTFFKLVLPAAAPNIESVEYFFNSDPGLGQGMQAAFISGSDSLSLAIDVSGLSSGFHSVFFRSRDALGRWSHTAARSFLMLALPPQAANLSTLEYFFDSDPGLGQGMQATFNGGSDSLNLTIDVSGLSPGFHSLFLRGRDAQGIWSHTTTRDFVKMQLPSPLANLRRIEYFIDQDPGLGNGKPVNLPADSSLADVLFQIQLDSIDDGFHTLFARAEDQNGRWSQTERTTFYKYAPPALPSNLLAAEYFFDSDPGFGQGNTITLNSGPTLPFFAFQPDLQALNYGQHILFVRIRNAEGEWSLTKADSIFYYLDSLPTASLSGPLEVCLSDSALFTVSLTGTPPWQLIIDRGYDTITASGIANSPFTFYASPASPGTFTAKVLEVSDQLYTGLYTGLPIEYLVRGLPDAAGPIYGSADHCEGLTEAVYWANYVTGASTYTWTPPQGTVILQEGANGYGVWVRLGFTGNFVQGSLSFSGNNHCGHGPASFLNIRMHPYPVVDAGPDILADYGDTIILNPVVSGGTPPYHYQWQAYWWFQQSNVANASMVATSSTALSLSVTDSIGCSSTDGLFLYVGPQTEARVSGVVAYDNSAGTLLDNTLVRLLGPTARDSMLTTPAGSYLFDSLGAGSYYMNAAPAKAWGGVNATDALLVLKHFVDSVHLGDLRVRAADVNGNGYINAVDALWCARRFTGLDTTFPIGDWISEEAAFYTPGIGDYPIDIKVICSGDVDGSHQPGKKAAGNTRLIIEGEIKLNGDIHQIPVKAGNSMQIGAVSLHIAAPRGIQILNADMPEGRSGELIFNTSGSDIRIAWFSLEPMHIKGGDVLMNLQIKANGILSGNWGAGMESSIAGPDGKDLDQAILLLPSLAGEEVPFAIEALYPNPWKEETLLRFSLAEAAQTEITLMNAGGQISAVLYSGSHPAGVHEVSIPRGKLAAGFYICRFTARSASYQFEESREMILLP